MNIDTVIRRGLLWSFLLLLIGCVLPTYAQHGTLEVSTEADFSTQDKRFTSGETLYLRVTVNTDRFDVMAAEKSEFELEPEGNGDSVSGSLTNNLDGTFTGSVEVSRLDGGARTWILEVELEDDTDHEVEVRSTIMAASNGTSQTFDLRGTVASTAEGSFTVGDHTVQVSDTTEITNYTGADVALQDLVDKKVRVRVQKQSDGSLLALQVVVQDSSYAEVELVGSLDAAAEGTIEVEGFTVTTNADTDITGQHRRPASVGDLIVGSRVKVEARRKGDGWVATDIHLEDVAGEDDDSEEEESELTINGSVETINTLAVTVGGIDLAVDSATEFDGLDGLTDLAAGAVVEIEFSHESDGSYLITSIELEEEDGEDESDDEETSEEVEAEGSITAVSETSISVGEISFTITSDTEISGETDTSLSWEDLYTGLKVEVEGRRHSDGTVNAVVIEIEDELESEFEVKGEVTAVNDTTITIGETLVHASTETSIEGEEDAALTPADVEVGMWAEAEGVVKMSGDYVADKIEVERRFEEDDVEVTGAIVSAGSGEITVSDLTFTVDSSTEILDQGEEMLTLEDLSEDWIVEVEGHYAADGTLAADKVKVEEQLHYEGEFEGSLTSVGSEGEIEIAGISFRTADRTIVEGVNAVTDLTAGQRVDVDFRLLADGTRLTLKVEVEEDDENGVELTGLIQDVGTDTVTTAGITVNIGGETVITGVNGESLAVTDLAAGTAVEIEGTDAGDGNIDASTIEVEEAAIVGGTVENSAQTNGSVSATVAGRNVEITSETFVIGQNNTSLTLGDIQDGVYVQVRGVSTASAGTGKTAASSFTARRVKIQGSSTSTAVEEESELPAAFTLEQNYPNPFNPTTTIRYSLPQADRAKLTVYDVLGRRVTVLVDRPHEAGTHTVQFDAGHLPSGLYIYQLKADGVTRTQQMMLVK